MPHHHVANTRLGTLAFRTHTEARWLWDLVLEHIPDPMALCLMPDHVHLLHRRDVHQALGTALGAFARRRNAARGDRGQVWRRQPPPDPVLGQEKVRRSVRYVHLNPCRGGLATDPLAWPWSTHRDRVGLALPPAIAPAPDPHDFHAYVSADPTVHPSGTTLPTGSDRRDLDAICMAVAALTRSPDQQLSQRGAARSLLLRSVRCLSTAPVAALSHALGVHRTTLERTPDTWTLDIRTVARVLGDTRFPGLATGDLRQHPAWHRYRSRR